MDTQTRKIIAFAGPATVGKSTAAKVLLNRGFKRLSFADPIRDMLRAIGVPEDKLTVDKETPVDLLCGKTCRLAMQKLGTEWGRGEIGENFWANLARYRMRNSADNIVIDDARFDNEALAILDVGGILVELSRPGIGYTSGHASEAGINPKLFTHRIVTTSIAELERKVLGLLN